MGDVKIPAVIAFVRAAAPVFFGALAALIPCVAILYFGIPAWFPGWITEDMNTMLPGDAPGGESARVAWTVFVALATVWLMQIRGAAGRWLSPAFLLAALAVAQSWLWQSAVSKYVLLGGLIPFSDAGVYTEYANELVQNHQVGYALQDRPMFPALLSTLLLFCGRNPQIALGILLVIFGVALHVATRSVRVWFGKVNAVAFLAIVFLYFARWIGTTMTEHLGLDFGLLACPLLLGGFFEKRARPWLAGTLVLTFALCARAGAFFVLPALCLLAAIHFKGERRFVWKLPARMLGLIIAAMALSRFLAFCVFDADNFPRSNFDYTAYGVIFEKRWDTAFLKYGKQHDKIQEAIIERIKQQPSSLPKGMWRAWRDFFKEYAPFRFMGGGCAEALQWLGILAFLLACWRKVPASPFVVAVCLGIGASIPCMPPWDADTMRVYAATIPLHALIAALGVGSVWRLVATRFPGNVIELPVVLGQPGESDRELRISVACSAVLLVLVFVVPITRLSFFSSKKRAQSVTSLAEHPGKLFAGTYVSIVTNDFARTHVPAVRRRDFRTRLASLAYVFEEEGAALRKLPSGVTIVSGGFRLVILPTEKLHRADSTAKFRRVKVGAIQLDVDVDLTLPFETPPPPE